MATIQFEKSEKRVNIPQIRRARAPVVTDQSNRTVRFFFSQKIRIWKKNLIRLIYQIKQTARIVFQEKSIYSLLRKWAMLLLILNRRECDTNDELVNSYK